MIVVPIYLAIDTDDEDVARAVIKDYEFSDDFVEPLYQFFLVEHRGERPVLLEVKADDEPYQTRTYLPVPGLKIRRST